MTLRSSRIPLGRPRAASLAFLVILIALLAGFVPAARPQAAAAKPRIIMYRGLGTWVDMYDAKAWSDPVAAVADMASHGVRTLYLETANFHYPTTASMFSHGKITAADFIRACHAEGIKIVAWYLPSFDGTARDLTRSMAAIDYRTPDGQRFDSFALDIEWTKVKPATLRTTRLLALSAKIRAAAGGAYPLGAIIMSPVGMTRSPSIWPGFPYAGLAGIYDVFVPMGYYTYHGDGYANAYNDTRGNVAIIRAKTGLPSIPIHVIGGDAAKSSPSETLAYVRALRETGCLGGSMYDWATTDAADWAPLAGVRFNPVQAPALPVDVGYAAPLGNCPGDVSHPKEVFYQALKQDGERILHFRLWDVQTDEVRLVVNWQDAGPLDAGPKGKWSGVRSIAIPASMLNAKGRNVIGFVARGDAPSWERWGVRDVTLVKP
ncbi:MAG: hypothetical protein WCN81_09420 [Actinomycetes bacterium]